jgi:hypothetical protein
MKVCISAGVVARACASLAWRREREGRRKRRKEGSTHFLGGPGLQSKLPDLVLVFGHLAGGAALGPAVPTPARTLAMEESNRTVLFYACGDFSFEKF